MYSSTDIAAITSAGKLRDALLPAYSAGRCAWIRLGGLSASAESDHRGLLRELRRFGLGGEPPRAPPEVAVLDWTGVRGCAADGLALFGVITRTLSDLGVEVLACAPDDFDLASALEHSGLRSGCGEVRWIAGAAGPARRLESLGPAALFDRAGDRRTFATFVDGLERALGAASVDNVRAEQLVATVVDLLQNVLSHADADHACALALLHRRKRPPEIEIGVADGGRGIVAGVLAQSRHGWLLPFTDTTVVSAALMRGLSARDAEDGGGVLTGLVRGLIEDCGAVVTVRSDTALLTLKPPGARCVPAYLSCGWGTQTLIRLRARP